jgi:choice-of-anchor B domain-containing protein
MMRFRTLTAVLVLAGTAQMAAQSTADGSVAQAQFGRSLAASGDQIFVGEPAAGTGQVTVYRKVAARWQSVAKLTAADLTGNAGLGISVAADGNTLLAGVMNISDSARGGVQVFTRNAAGAWTAAGALGGPAKARSQFGLSVAIKGDWAFVGAPGTAPGGAVHVFQRTGTTWTAAGTLPAAGLVAGDRFGLNLSLDGDRIAVAAPGRDSQKGMVFIFARGANGWTQESAVSGRRIPTTSQMGLGLLLTGEHLYAGAPNANGFAGMVATFTRGKDGQWVEGTTLSSFEMGTARYGSSIVKVGNELWIGASSEKGQGRIHRIALNESGDLMAANRMANDSMGSGASFGHAMAVSGNILAVGMPNDGGGEGSVAVYERATTGAWTMRAFLYPAPDELAAVTGAEVRCGDDGKAGEFGCSNASLISFLPISQIGGKRGSRLNDNWGWTDPTNGREYALVGRTDGTSFVDVTNPTAPRYLGDLPLTPGANPNVWRDMKVYKNHVFVVMDGAGPNGHGMQVFDLTRLRNIRTPQTFTPDAHYDRIGSAHNIVLNEESGFAYAVGVSGGGETCGGGLHMIDVRTPKSPTFAGCFSDPKTGRSGTGYSHDAQCVMYKGPDTQYQGKEICIGSNETAISIADVTNKSAPVAISSASYPDVGYAHQAWLTDDQRYLFLGDELDEGAGVGEAAKGTRTLIWDLADLDDPVLVKQFVGTTPATDHNLYIKGNRMYQANYQAGLRILDISDPANPREVGYLDTFPTETTSSMAGAWSNYPYFKSGTIIVTSVSEGLFLVRDRTQAVP